MALHPDAFCATTPTDDQMDTVNRVCKTLATCTRSLEQELPDGPDKTYVIRMMRTVAMWSTTAILRNPDGSSRME